MQKIKSLALIFGVLTMSFLVGYLVLAWVEPGAAPPGGNVPAPINVGSTQQWKEGGLGVGTKTFDLSSGQIAASIFYDKDNSSWYVNPAGTSVLSGNVGIGTTGPGYKLDVSGTGRFTSTLYANSNLYVSGIQQISKSAHSAGANAYHLELYSPNTGSASNEVSLRFHQGNQYWYQIRARSGGFRFTGGSTDDLTTVSVGTLCIGTDCRTSWPVGTLTGSGSTNYITKWTGATSLGNSQIYDNGGKVGIGTTAPAQKLHVAGNLQVDGAIVAPEGTLRDDGGGWVRTYGNTGWYSQSYGGGWYMTDTSWIRSYGSKNVYINTMLRADGGFQVDGYEMVGSNANMLYANRKNTAGGGIWISDDGGFYDYNNAYIDFRGSTGIRVLESDGSWGNNSIRAANLCIQNDCRSSWPAGGDISGSGSTNYVAKFTGTKTIGNSQIYDNGTNVGIGTASPVQKLDVRGNIYSTGHHYINNTSPTIYLQDTDHYSGMIHQNSNLMYFLTGSGVNSTSWAIHGSYWPLTINMTNDALTFGGAAYFMEGNVGIGTTAPAQKLHVAGNLQVDGAIVAPEGTLRDDGGGWVRTYGNTGWYSQSYGGGWYMTDTSWIRSYGSKNVYINTMLRADGGFQVDGYEMVGSNANMLYANRKNTAGGGIWISDDGGFYDYNNAYIDFRGSTGIRVLESDGSWGNNSIRAANLCIQDDCRSSWPAGGDISGSRSTNYLTKFTGTKTIGNSIIYDNGTNVGIGTTAPGARLDLEGGNIIDVNKISVNTIDPIFKINNKKYASYVPDVIGKKVEVIGVGKLTDGRWEIDLANQEDSSDLWLFYNIVKRDTIIPFISPQDKADLYGYLDETKFVVELKDGGKEARFSYFLIGERIDSEQGENVLSEEEAEKIGTYIDVDSLR